MPDEVIKVRIESEMDFGETEQQLHAAYDNIRGMKEEMADMPNISRIFNTSLEKTASIVDSVAGKVEALSTGKITDSDKKEDFIKRSNEAIKDANVMYGLQTGSSSYGIQIARAWFKDLPQAVQQELDAITPRITNILRSRMSTLAKDGIHYDGQTATSLAYQMMQDDTVKEVLNKYVKTANKNQVEGYLQRIIPHAVAHNRLSAWHEARYGSAMIKGNDALINKSPKEIIPASYLSSLVDAMGYRRTQLSESEAKKVLSSEQFANLRNVLAKYPIAVKAAERARIARRDDRGVLELKRDLTRAEWEDMREALYDQLENRATGAGNRRIDIYDKNNEFQLGKRLASSSAGAAVLAMKATEGMSSPEAWINKTDEAGYVKQQKEARRILDRYAARKYAPFVSHDSSFDSNPYARENSQFVMIPESQNTKLLSKGAWRNNQDISDTVALISLAGYDPENKEHFEKLRDLYANGKTINGVKMVAQSTHGTGSDTVIRMISKEAYDRVEKEEQEWAKQNGFSGSYFQNFTDTQRAAMAVYQAKHPGVKVPSPLTEKMLGKQYDAENKPWSPSADMMLNLNGKRFAVVDLNGQGDGSAWFSDSVVPYANQTRFGLGGKGSIFTFRGKNNREFAERSGFLDDQGRWMAKGINGEMYDIADYDGIIPVDVIKNLLSYGHVDPSTGEFVYGKKIKNKAGGEMIDTSNEAVNEMVTAALRRYGPRAIANYEDENTDSNKLGAQMTSFMLLSPEMQAHQAEMYAKRMQELDTEEGQLRYVFNNKEEDWVAKQVWENPQLLATPTARNRVDAYRNSLQQSVAAGQYIDFGQDDTKISDVRLADNMLRAFLAETTDEETKNRVFGKMKEAMANAYDDRVRTLIELDNSKDSYAEKLKRAEDTVSKERKRDYTNQELWSLLNLERNVNGDERIVDFEHMDQRHVGVLRSPTGYGNMVFAENIASEIAPIFDKFGISKTGTFVSQEALETLQSADYDGDRAKIVTGELANAVRRTVFAVNEQKKRVENANKDIKTEEVHYDADLMDDATQRALAAGRNVVAPIRMGGASGGIRGMQVDLSNPINNPYIIAQEKMQKMYDKSSVYPKSPEEIDLKGEREYWNTLKLGREFTKFTDKAETVFQYDSDQLDSHGKVKANAPDIFKTSSGQLINMRRVRDLQIDQTNLPSVNMSSHLMGLSQTRRAYMSGLSDTTTWDAIAEAFQNLELPEGAGEKAKALIMAKRQMFPQFGSGERAQITDEETLALERMLAEAKGELRLKAKKNELKGTGVFMSPDGKTEYQSIDEYIKSEGKEYGFDVVEKALDVFGPTRARLRSMFGDKTADSVLNNDSITALNGVVADQVMQQASETAQQAAEAVKEQVESAKPQSNQNKTTSELRQEASSLLSEAGLNKNDVANIMAIPHDTLADIVQEGDTKSLQLIRGIGEKKAQKAIAALSGSAYAGTSQPESQTPPERLVKCSICGTEYPESLGECPNAANHPSKSEMKKDQKQLANIEKAEDNPYKTMEQTYGKLLSDFSGIESTKALAMKAIENNDRILQGYRKINNENEEQTQAEQFYNIKAWERRKAHEDLKFIDEKGNEIALGQVAPGERDKILRDKLEDQVSAIDRGYVGATRQWGINYTGNIVEQLNKSVNGVGDEFDKQQQQIQSWAEAVKEAQSALESFKASREEMKKEGSVFSESDLKKDFEAEAKMQADIEKAKELEAQGRSNIQTKNNQMFQERAENLYNQMYGKTASPLEKVDYQVSAYKDRITEDLAKLESAHTINPETGMAAITDKDYLARKAQLEELQKYADGTLRSDMYNRLFDQQSRQTDRMILQSDRMTRQHRSRASMRGIGRFILQNENEYQQREIWQESMQARLDQLKDARDGRLDKETGKRTGGMDKTSEEYKRATEEINKLNKAMADNQSAMNGLKGPAGALDATFSSMQLAVSRLAARFGRQLFQKALTEAKKFVVQYNRTMTEIQMITLKTDDQMTSLGDGLVQKAKEMKVSIADLSKSAATLYRQGLSDEEVDERLGVISKFSTVSGTKIDAATKLITVAMNTGLVTDPQFAADIVTALGDNAATNASEIEKGIEKAGAAAAADGTTFGQLTAMLTAILSTTQIGGSVAGRTLNTIFGRMNKIGTNELIYDENGNAVSGSAVAKLLERQGISMYDENGNKRSSYDTLYALSRKWETMSDAEQQQIATAIAGTRQYSNFAAIMQGMSEGKVDQYMALIGDSSGIVDKKYDVYVQSLDASLTNLKNTFDSLVKDLTNTGVLTGAIDILSGMIQGVDNLTNSVGGLGAMLTTVMPLFIGLTAMKIGMSTGNVPALVAGLGLTLGGVAIASIAGNQGPTAAERNQAYDEAYHERLSKYEGIERLQELRGKQYRTDEENQEYAVLINKYAQALGLTNDAAGAAAYSVDNLSNAIRGMSDEADNAADHILQEADAEKQREFANRIVNTRGDTIYEMQSSAAEKTAQSNKQFDFGNTLFAGRNKLWYYDETQKEYVLNPNALKNQEAIVQNGLVQDSTIWDIGQPSYSKEIKNPLVDFYYNAASSGKGPLAEKYGDKDKNWWSWALSTKGIVTQDVLEQAFDYYNRAEYVTPNSREARKSTSKEILTRLLSDFYTEDQIDYLANLMTDQWEKTGDLKTAYNNLTGSGKDFDSITAHLNKQLEGHRSTSVATIGQYGLQDVGTSGYYIGPDGRRYTLQQAEQYLDEQYGTKTSRAAQVAYEHDQRVLAAHEREARNIAPSIAAEQNYYKDLWIERYGQAFRSNAGEIWDGMSNSEKQRYIQGFKVRDSFENAPESVQQKYLGQWETMSEEEQQRWVDVAKDVVKLDTSKLSAGAEMTVDELENLINSGGALLEEVVNEISSSEDRINKEAPKKFKAVTNAFVDAMEGYSVGDNSWLTKNQAAVSADTVTGILLSQTFGEGKEGLGAFMDYVNSNPTASLAWQQLMAASPELLHVMHQAEYNEATGQWTAAPEDIMSQVLHAVQSGSLVYGSSYLTTEQKGTLARSAYQGLTNEGWYISPEERDNARDAAYAAYQESLAPYYEQVAAVEAQDIPQWAKEYAKSSIRGVYNPLTKEEFIARNADLNLEAMSPEQQQYLKAVLGDQMYGRVLEARKGGKALTDNERRYAELLLNNNANGLTSLTGSQQLAGIRGVRYAIRNGTFERDAAADQYMSGWSGWQEYAYLLSKRNNGTLNAEDRERLGVLEQSLQSFEENAEIKIQIEGVQELENAGEIASGTAAEIEKLKKGGKIALEVTMKYRTEGFEQGQQTAKLYNGTATEQDEAAMAVLGMSRDQFYADREANLERARSIERGERDFWARTWTERYNNAETEDQRRDILEAARLAGYEGYGIESFYGPNGAQSKFAGIAYNGLQGITNVNPLLGTARTYTETEKNRMLNDILEGKVERTVGEGGNAELYDAALESAGEYARLQLWWQQNSEEPIPEWLRIASENERSAQRNTTISGYSSQVTQGQRAQYALSHFNGENIGYLATYLDMSEEDIRNLWDNGNGEDALKKEVQKKQSATMSAIAEQFGFEFDESNMEQTRANITAAMNSTSDEFERTFLAFLLSITDSAESIFSPKAGKTFAQQYTENVEALERDTYGYSAYKFIRDNAATALQMSEDQNLNLAQSYQGLPGWNQEWTSVLSDKDLYAMMNLYQSGRINEDQFANYAETQMSSVDKPFAYYDLLAQTVLPNSYKNGQFMADNLAADVEAARTTPELAGALDQLIGKYPELEDAVKGSTTALRYANDQLKSDKVSNVVKYAKGINGLEDAMSDLSKGGNNIAKGFTKIDAGMKELQDRQTAITNASGKSGKQLQKMKDRGDQTLDILASMTPYDADQLAKMSEDELKKVLDQAQPQVNEDFADTVESLFSMLPHLNPEINLADLVTVTADGQIELNDVENILTDTEEQILQRILSLAGTYANVDVSALLRGDSISVQAFVQALRNAGVKTGSGGGYSRNNKKSGGGGKSQTDKTIEEAEYRVNEAQHKVKMTQLEQEHYAFTNQYQEEIDAIYAEVAAQKGLADVYQDNLGIYRQQQNAVKQYSEEWWKLEKQILSTEEALKEVENTIEALGQKEIAVVQRRQENQDAPQNYARNMIDSYVERYRTLYESGGNITQSDAYKHWVSQQTAQVVSTQQVIEQNNAQIAEWQALLDTLDKDTQNYNDVQQKIWDIQKENASLENELIQKEIDLNNARLERIAQVLQNNMGAYEHAINMADTRGQIYEIDRDYAGYRAEIAKQQAQYKNEASSYTTALLEARKQMASLEEGSSAWYTARDAVFEYEEALEKLNLTQKELDQTLRESYLNELYEKIEKADTENQQTLTAAQIMTERAKTMGNNSEYLKGLEDEEAALIKQAQTERENFEMLMELKNSGKIKKGTKEWDDLLSRIKDVQNQIGKTENDALAKASEVATVRLDNIMNDYKDNTRDIEHRLAMLQYQESRYKNNGELTNRGRALEAERTVREELLAEQLKTRTRLESELGRYAVGSEQYNNVLEQLNKINEEIAKTGNEIDNLTLAIEQNQEAIRKAKINLENLLNNEMKKRVQEEKDRLSAEVNLQKSIIDVIKKRYQDEWKLIKQDLEKKKQALQEEKSLIQERVNARKQAEQAEDKQSKLNELQRQLAIIEADPTRSKEAKELRKQIEDLNKEISGNLADNIAKAESKRLDDMIKGITDYETNREEDMNEFLSDNNNFREILDNVLGGAEEDYVAYMKEFDENYKNETAERRQLFELGWHETWLKMKGEVENYWEEVLHYTEITEENQDQIRQDMLDYLMQGTEYENSSLTKQQSLVYEWTKLFNDYASAVKVSADAGVVSTTDVSSAVSNERISELQAALLSNTYSVNLNDKAMAALSAMANILSGTNQYATGGLVNYTGIAKVDGTPSRPEAFLSAHDTANIRMMLNQFDYMKSLPVMSSIPGDVFNGGSSIGDVYVTINEAEINSDQDIDALAKRVGKAFTKQLTRNGFNTASYAF